MITIEIIDNATAFKANGHQFALITKETESSAINKFKELCDLNANELTRICIEYEEKRQWNFENMDQGKDWPIFKIKDRLVNKLLAQAGIKDS